MKLVQAPHVFACSVCRHSGASCMCCDMLMWESHGGREWGTAEDVGKGCGRHAGVLHVLVLRGMFIYWVDPRHTRQCYSCFMRPRARPCKLHVLPAGERLSVPTSITASMHVEVCARGMSSFWVQVSPGNVDYMHSDACKVSSARTAAARMFSRVGQQLRCVSSDNVMKKARAPRSFAHVGRECCCAAAKDSHAPKPRRTSTHRCRSCGFLPAPRLRHQHPHVHHPHFSHGRWRAALRQLPLLRRIPAALSASSRLG